jgi:radical SAM protein with 4Fe4S-binding SPASM domain
LLRQGTPIRQAVRQIEAGCGEAEAQTALEELLAEIIDKEFESGAAVQPDLSPSPYIIISLNVTNACNLRCVTCYRFSGPPDTNELGQDEWLRVLREHYELGGKVVKISGGEPLYRDRQLVYDLIRTAKTRGMHTLLLSNGLLIDKPTALALDEAGLERIQISLDGPDRETNDRIRGDGVFEKVLEALAHLCDSTRIEVYLAMLPVPGISLEALQGRGAEFAAQLRARFGQRLTISVSQGILDGREVCHEESLAFVRACRGLQDKLGTPQTTAGHDLWQWEPGRRNLSCGYGRTLGIEPNGSVWACAGGEVVGNVRDMSLSAIGEKLRAIALSYTVDALEECGKCALRYLCGGPCRVRPDVCTEGKKYDLLGRLICSNALRYKITEDA